MIQNIIDYATANPLNFLFVLGLILAVSGLFSFFFGILRKLIWLGIVVIFIAVIFKFLTGQNLL